MNSVSLPKLYKLSAHGKIQEWSICTRANILVTTWGQTDGALQTTEDIIVVGKNLGKVNATTPIEQAQREAYSRWEHQLKSKKYTQSIETAQAGESDMRVLGGIDCMLAHSYDKYGHKVQWPALVQPKLDGHRCIAVVEAGVCSLWSRTRKRISSVPHIVQAVETWASRVGRLNVTLDGELYVHEYHNKFEELSSLIRSSTPQDGHEVMQYHVYDIVDAECRQQTRSEILGAFTLGHSLVRVETTYAQTEAEMLDLFAQFKLLGYEGAIVRNLRGSYVHRRSYDLQKVKSMEDAEFVIVDVREGRGKMSGHAVFICRTADGKTFDVVMKCPMTERERQWRERASFIGKTLTVQFLNLTADGLPRGPVGLRIREDL